MELYTNVLTNNEIDAGKLSAGLREMIADYEKATKRIKTLKSKLEDATAEEKVELEQEIDDLKATQNEINEALVNGINKYMKNREKGKQLAASRGAKNEGANTGATQTAKTAQAPASSTATATPAAGTQTAATSKQPAQVPAKKDNTAGVIFGIFVGLTLLVAGSVWFYKNKSTV